MKRLKPVAKAVGIYAGVFLALLALSLVGILPGHLVSGLLCLMSFGVGFLLANAETPYWLWGTVSFVACVLGASVIAMVVVGAKAAWIAMRGRGRLGGL